MTERLETMRAHMDREGVSRERVIPVAVMLSESVVLQELWREPRGSAQQRARMIHSLGLPAETDDAALLNTLVDEVRQAFCDFLESSQGLAALNAYDELLARYEQAGLMLVVGGHDSGPLLGELARHGVKVDAAFTLSLLFEPRVLGVGAGSAAPGQVLVAGLNPAQLAQAVAQLRQLNPRLTNRQVRQVLLSVLGEMRGEAPRTLGHAQVERMHELARQLLKFKALEYLCP